MVGFGFGLDPPLSPFAYFFSFLLLPDRNVAFPCLFIYSSINLSKKLSQFWLLRSPFRFCSGFAATAAAADVVAPA